jgi:hypothetical protein
MRSYKNFTVSVELKSWAEEKERHLHPLGKKSPSNNVSVATMILLEQSGVYFYCHLLELELSVSYVL